MKLKEIFEILIQEDSEMIERSAEMAVLLAEVRSKLIEEIKDG